MSRFAEGTKVPVSKTIGEIEDLVRKRGGQRFFRAEQEDAMSLGWAQSDRMVMFTVHMPPLKDFEKKPRGYARRSVAECAVVREQAMREHWRAVLLVIKAKFASVDSKIESFEESFLSQIVVPGPDGRHTQFAKLAIKSIAEVYTKGGPLALPSGAPA